MKLIDADAAKKAVHEEFDECLVWDESGEHTANVIEEILEELPTVEAEPVTRCKDCKHYADECCDRYADETLGYVHSTQEYGYCWVAERKEE